MDKNLWIKNVLEYPIIEHDELTKIHRSYKATRVNTFRDKILLSHLRMVIKPALYYNERFHDDIFFDLVNAGVLAISRAIDSWDSGRKIYFNTYSNIFVWRACYWMFHKYKNKTHHVSTNMSSPEIIVDIDKCNNQVCIDSGMREFSSLEAYQVWTSCLNKKEQAIIDAHILDEKTWTQVSKTFKISRAALEKKRVIIYDKIKKRIESCRR